MLLKSTLHHVWCIVELASSAQLTSAALAKVALVSYVLASTPLPWYRNLLHIIQLVRYIPVYLDKTDTYALCIMYDVSLANLNMLAKVALVSHMLASASLVQKLVAHNYSQLDIFQFIQTKAMVSMALSGLQPLVNGSYVALFSLPEPSKHFIQLASFKHGKLSI